MEKTLWQKIYHLLGFRSYYEYDGRIKYKTFYWISKKFTMFSYVVKE